MHPGDQGTTRRPQRQGKHVHDHVSDHPHDSLGGLGDRPLDMSSNGLDRSNHGKSHLQQLKNRRMKIQTNWLMSLYLWGLVGLMLTRRTEASAFPSAAVTGNSPGVFREWMFTSPSSKQDSKTEFRATKKPLYHKRPKAAIPFKAAPEALKAEPAEPPTASGDSDANHSELEKDVDNLAKTVDDLRRDSQLIESYVRDNWPASGIYFEPGARKKRSTNRLPRKASNDYECYDIQDPRNRIRKYSLTNITTCQARPDRYEDAVDVEATILHLNRKTKIVAEACRLSVTKRFVYKNHDFRNSG